MFELHVILSEAKNLLFIEDWIIQRQAPAKKTYSPLVRIE